MTMKNTEMNKKLKYLLIKDSKLSIIYDPILEFKNGQINPETDVIYMLGNELKLKIVMEPVASQREWNPHGDKR